MDEPRVLVRVDAGMGMGHGHLMRTMSVVRALATRGVSVTVATRARGAHIARAVAGAGARPIYLPEPTSDEDPDGECWSAERQVDDVRGVLELDPGPWDTVVVDHYCLDEQWERAVRPFTARIVVIDDLANRAHDADVLVDHNWYGDHTADRYRDLVPGSTTLLLGPRYALLHAEYAATRATRGPVAHPPRRVVVNFGGTDVRGQTLRAVQALDVLPDAEVDVVIGAARAVTDELRAAVAARPRTTLHVEAPTLAPLLGVADLAIGAGGTSTWERLCLGVPALVTTVSDNQSGVTQAFHRAGMTRWLGTGAEMTTDHYRRALREYLVAPPLDVPAVVDGYGAHRVGYAIVPPDAYSLRARPATASDDASFVTAAGAGILDDGGPATWRRRARWFARAVDSGVPVRILEYDGTPVGAAGGPESDSPQLDSFVATTDVA